MQGQRLIIGVRHVAEEELNKVKSLLFQRLPSKVGLELPEDYEERLGFKVGDLFFSDIASYLKSLGIKALYLESPEAWDNNQTTNMAKAVREGRIKKEDIEIELNHVNQSIARTSCYTAPELLYRFNFFGRRYEKALEILAKYSTLEEVLGLWDQTNIERESHVLERIKKDQPDIAIIGDAHAQKLKGSLPEYFYLRFYL